jgi:hypothetical protein
VENHICLSRGVQVVGATWQAVTRIMTKVGEQVQRTEDGHTGQVLSGRMIGRSGDAVCGVHRARGARVSWLSLKTKVYDLSVVWPQNHWDGFLRFGLKTGGVGFHQFGLKNGGDGFLQFDLKIGGDGFLWFDSKLVVTVFSGLASKPVATIFLVWPQNQC